MSLRFGWLDGIERVNTGQRQPDKQLADSFTGGLSEAGMIRGQEVVPRRSIVAKIPSGSQHVARSFASALRSRLKTGSLCAQSCRHFKFASSFRAGFLGSE